ncbi:hypothetical protein GWI33_020183 [Rhynchophorus ferrugineus]|uniref:FAS1 domain-containing protein n=1 Tax=Rhynchophorus ferrugineus TaxID=354439 RepID=A0A834I3V7_RHYFE|nr:hypothetical protein GWI33_020183 [Rhynchophorus ferrugineus]
MIVVTIPLIALSVVCDLVFCHVLQNYPQRSIYNRITQEDEFRNFDGLIRNNKDARMDLLQKELTLFIPTNAAFENYTKPLYSDMAFYHMAKACKTINELKTIPSLSSTKYNLPKLWITKTTDKLFINNAEVLPFNSNYVGRTRHAPEGHQQILHIIDGVLDPLIRIPESPQTAYDFMTSTWKWDLDVEESVTSFLHKVNENGMAHLFQVNGGNTFFIPVDRSIDTHKFRNLNKKTIFGHIVPNFVLFTRPTMRGFNYETMANDDKTYMVLYLEEIGSELHVKSVTIQGTTDNPTGHYSAKILQANIPVHNGVIHLISQPLGIKNKTRPFPYLPIIEKLSRDPALDTFYSMGDISGFNKIFTSHDVTFTYFIPNDYSWRQMKRSGLKYFENNVDLLKRHLVISDAPYTMERMLAITKSQNNTSFELKTTGGIIKIAVFQIGTSYYVKYKRAYIEVLRPNYECTDGIIHVLAGPMADLF